MGKDEAPGLRLLALLEHLVTQGEPQVLLPHAQDLLALAAFVAVERRVQQRTGQPMLDLSLFRYVDTAAEAMEVILGWE